MSEAWVAAATDIGIKICRDALWDGDRCTWIVAATDPSTDDGTTYFRTAEPCFYSGTAGTAFFLHHLSTVTDEPTIRATARAAARQSFAGLDQVAPEKRAGFFTGYVGILELLGVLAADGTSDEFAAMATAVLQRILSLDPRDLALDVVSGAAGAIPPLIARQRCAGGDALAAFVSRLGERLLDAGVQDGRGTSWPTVERARVNWTGYSHGVAGILVALLELHAFTGNAEFAEVADAAYRYETSYFDQSDRNWLDLRHIGEDAPAHLGRQRCANFWCHGAPGIGQGRLAAYRLTGDRQYLREVAVATQTCLERTDPSGPHNGYSLCHGILGNYELALNAAPVLADPSLASQVADACDRVTEYVTSGTPIPNGIGNTYDIPTFMTGSAGMGYFLLRAHAPDVFPSMLLLESSRSA